MKKIKVGIVGVGRLGKHHARNLASHIPTSELLAVCSLREEEVMEIQKTLNIKYTYTNYDEMLQNSALDAIFIASPSSFHAEQIKKALESGFHVFCEKPLGLTYKEVISLKSIVERFPDQLFMLGFMRRFDPSYKEAKRQIDNGTIGKPVYIRCYGMDPASEIDSFLKYAKKNNSGGIFLDMAIHDFDLAHWFLQSKAKNVWAVGNNYVRKQFKEIDDVEFGSALVNYENGAIGSFVVSRNSVHGYHIETEIIGTEGALRIGTVPQKNDIVILNEHGVVQQCYENFIDRFENAYRIEAESFIQSIIEKSKSPVTVYDGVESTKLAYACKKSLETGELVSMKDYNDNV